MGAEAMESSPLVHWITHQSLSLHQRLCSVSLTKLWKFYHSLTSSLQVRLCYAAHVTWSIGLCAHCDFSIELLCPFQDVLVSTPAWHALIGTFGVALLLPGLFQERSDSCFLFSPEGLYSDWNWHTSWFLASDWGEWESLAILGRTKSAECLLAASCCACLHHWLHVTTCMSALDDIVARMFPNPRLCNSESFGWTKLKSHRIKSSDAMPGRGRQIEVPNSDFHPFAGPISYKLFALLSFIGWKCELFYVEQMKIVTWDLRLTVRRPNQSQSSVICDPVKIWRRDQALWPDAIFPSYREQGEMGHPKGWGNC